MLISQEVLKIIVDDWIKTEKSLAKVCRGKFEESYCYASAYLCTGFGYVLNTYNATARKTQDKSIWVYRVEGEEKWIIFTQPYGLNVKPVIEIWDDRINIRLDDDNLNGWDYLRIEALYDKLKPYVLYDIPDSDMEERNSQAIVLGNCITDWLDKNRPIFKHPLEMASTSKHWHIEYETDDDHVSWANIPSFRIDIIDDMLKCHHLYGRYILHDMPEKDNKPYWVISDKPIPDYPFEYPITCFNQEKQDQMFIYIFRQHVEYILPENEQWFTGYTKNLAKSIREVMKDPNISDWCRELQTMYQQNALQYKHAEETLTTKRGELVRTHKEPETNKEKNNMNELISQKKLISIFQEWIEPFILENKDKWFFGIVDRKFYWNIDGKLITAQQCTEDNGTAYWRIYQNVNFDQPCLEIFPDHIRMRNDSGYYEAFSVNSIRDLAHMIEKNCFDDKGVISLNPDWVIKEENNMRIKLAYVAVKVECRHPHDCIISIGRLNDREKDELLKMFPSAIHSLRYNGRTLSSNKYQMTITATLPNIPDFKISDSDICDLSITDGMIISQTKSSETFLFVSQPNWFGDVHTKSIEKGRFIMITKEKLREVISEWIKPMCQECENTGGHWNSGSYAGLFCWTLNAGSAARHRRLSARLCYDQNKHHTGYIIYLNSDDEHPIIKIEGDCLIDCISDDNIYDFKKERLYDLINRIKQAMGQNIGQIKKEENTMFGKEEIDIIKGFIDEIKKLAADMYGPNETAEILNKSTETVCCDTPNATSGFTPGEVSKLIKSMMDSSMILVPTIKEIMINKPATIIFWSDGSKTTSVCDDADKFDPEVGISICIAKKYLGSTENLQLEARRALTRYERREAKKLKKTKKPDTNKSNTSSKKKK